MGASENLINTHAQVLKTQSLDQNTFNVVLLGPSGAGKSSVAEQLSKLGIADVNPTVATSPRRQFESAATLDHIFVSQQAFADQKQTDSFVVKKTYYGFEYGAPHLREPPVGQIALIVLKASFMEDFTAYYHGACIYQIETSPETAYQRMLTRGHSSDADIIDRMKQYGPELDGGRQLAHAIFNNDGRLDTTVKQVARRILQDIAAS